MTTATTPLLAGFDFDFAPSPHTPEDVPIATLPLTRPPTPDPRHLVRPHLQHHPQDFHNRSPLTRDQPKRARRTPPVLHLRDQSNRAEAPTWSKIRNEVPPNNHSVTPQAAYNPLPLRSPFTPSPRYPTAPSLASTGTTVASSPTITPSGALPGFGGEQDQRVWTGQRAAPWSESDRKFGLRRAKRLPHRDTGLWEVHAIVHVSSGSEQQQQQQVYSKHQPPECDHSYFRAFDSTKLGVNPDISTPTNYTKEQAFVGGEQARREIRARQSERGVRFMGISSESASREGRLRRAQHADSSTFSLSKYQFPPPTAPWRSPATVHYHGASFDLVNPHTSLLLGPPEFETPAEIDGLLDDYFEDRTMPRQLYTDVGVARRDMLHLGEDVRAAPDGAAGGPSPVSSGTERSDPFELTVSSRGGEEAEAAHEPQGDEGALGSTVSGILAAYDYTGDAPPPPPASDEATLRALEEGIRPGAPGRGSATSLWLESQMVERVAVAFGPPDVTQPSTSRTYGDTNVLLNIIPREPSAALSAFPGNEDATMAQMRPAPSRSTMQRESQLGRLSAQASLHGGDSPAAIPAMWSSGDLPEQRRGQLERFGLMEPSFGAMGRRESVYDRQDDGWETDGEPTEAYGRASEESYANTSHYGEQNRLSAFTDVDLNSVHENAGPEATALPSNRRDAATHDRTNSSDIRKASEYLFRSARDKAEHVFTSHRDRVVNQELEEKLLTGVPLKTSKSKRHAARHRLEVYRDQRKEASEEQGITNDAELEELRQKNPTAVRAAVGNAAEMMRKRTQAAGTGLRRVRDKLRNSVSDMISPNEGIALRDLSNLDHRGLISAVESSNGRRSTLAYSETDHTFRTIRDSNSIIAGLPGSHFDPIFGSTPPVATPPTAMTIGSRVARNPIARNAQPGDRPGASSHAKGKRRAAMSGQTTLRPFEISGSPTSNIQGAFTDREMMDNESRWRTRPPPAHRAQNLSGLLPQYNLRTSRPGDQGRMLITPGEVMSERDRKLQLQLSKRYLFRCLLFPPALLMYATGRLDYLIAKKSNGRIMSMAQSRKDEATKWAAAGALGYIFLIVAIFAVVALILKPT